jgi:hypothetical protein
MNRHFPSVPLGEVLQLRIDAVPVDPSISYMMAGVYSFGRGLFKRAPLSGTETTYKFLHRLHKDHFVISQPKAWEGALARVPMEFDGLFLSSVFPTFRALPDCLDVRYLEWYCKQATVWEELRSKARGMGARRESVLPNQFLSITIPLPMLSEQRRIVAKIDELAAKIEEARQLRRDSIVELEALLNAELGEIFRSRQPQTLLGDTLELHRGFDLPVQQRIPGLYPVFAANGEIGRHVESRMKGPGVCTGRSGSVGAVNYVEEDFWPLNTALYVSDFKGNNPRLIYYLLLSVSSDLKKISTHTAVPTLDRKKAHSQIKVHIPPLPEQGQIVAHLDGLVDEVNSLNNLQTETASEIGALLPSILDKAFKGAL